MSYQWIAGSIGRAIIIGLLRAVLQRRGLPDDVAAWIVLLASDVANWITGQVITVDGGLSIT
jgi:NAD(P)-dependent dehydrogenase (short-subunit alcohol dehydrogenase family)